MAQSEFFEHGRFYAGQTAAIPRRSLLADIREILPRVVKTCSEGELQTSDGKISRDQAVYTGVSGTSLALMHIFSKGSGDPDLFSFVAGGPVWANSVLVSARESLENSVYHGRKAESNVPLFDPVEEARIQGLGFYVGPIGPMVLLVAAYRLEEKQVPQHLVDAIFQCGLQLGETTDAAEILFGTAGYLYALTWLTKCQISIPHELVVKCVQRLINEGLQNATDGWPMMWQLWGQRYLGAAHGVAGILYVLLCYWEFLTPAQQTLTYNTLDKLRSTCSHPNRYLCFTSDDNNDWAHHFCHGFPGVVSLFAKASLMFPEARQQYEQTAKWCAECIWAEGMLRKGVGLCHGAFGNAYSFLCLYRLTLEQRYLFYAVSFYEISKSAAYRRSVATYLDPQRMVQGVPDGPKSLMEGEAGTLCFLVDLLHPETSNFPGFETTSSPPALDWIHRRYYPLLKPKLFSKKEGVDELAPGIWTLPVVDPAHCDSLLEQLYSSVPDEHRKVDAIRVGAPFRDLLSGITGLVQRFVDDIMIPSDPSAVTRRSFALDSRLNPDYLLKLNEEIETEQILDTVAYNRARIMTKGNSVGVPATESRQLSSQRNNSRIESSAIDELYVHDVRPRLHIWRAYVIRYGEHDHPKIQSHRDACDVTFNLCLRRTCEKGHLVFNDSGNLSYLHRPGDATIFWGDKTHHTHPVKGQGERAQLVILYNFLLRDDLRGPATRPSAQVLASSLNSDVLGVIFSFLPIWDLASVAYSCRLFNNISNDDDAWKVRYQRSTQCSEFASPEAVESSPLHLCVDCGEIVTCDRLTGAANWRVCDDCDLPFHVASCGQKELQLLRVQDWHVHLSCPECRSTQVAGPRLRIKKSKLGTTAAERCRRFFSRAVFASAWKERYHLCIFYHGMCQETLRRINKEERQMMWRAIIGCFPVHNLGVGVPSLPEKEEQSGVALESDQDSFSLCEECAVVDEAPVFDK